MTDPSLGPHKLYIIMNHNRIQGEDCERVKTF